MSISLILEDGTTAKNRELPFGERIECEIEYVSKREFEMYYNTSQVYSKETQEMTTSTVSEYDKCVSAKCSKITGCITGSGITNGETLVGFQSQPVLNDLITAIYNEIMGFAKTKPVVETPEDSGEVETPVDPSVIGGQLGDTLASV
ncbi:MAG: hypothetical protein ACTSRU_21500 [Candidatus Hodarchaeales archaeon]